MTGTRDERLWDLAWEIREKARDLREQARYLDSLAERVTDPGEGVRVEYDGRGTLRFVGPALITSSTR